MTYEEIESYENEIEDLQNRLDIAEYDKERLREEVTNLETKIKALEQEPRWIPVSERLPEKEYENYLVSTNDSEVDIGTYSVKGWSMCDADGFYIPQYKGIEVVSWMPLPKPYEPQETETWNGIHAQITAPKGTFDRIFNDADDENDI